MLCAHLRPSACILARAPVATFCGASLGEARPAATAPCGCPPESHRSPDRAAAPRTTAPGWPAPRRFAPAGARPSREAAAAVGRPQSPARHPKALACGPPRSRPAPPVCSPLRAARWRRARSRQDTTRTALAAHATTRGPPPAPPPCGWPTATRGARGCPFFAGCGNRRFGAHLQGRAVRAGADWRTGSARPGGGSFPPRAPPTLRGRGPSRRSRPPARPPHARVRAAEARHRAARPPGSEAGRSDCGSPRVDSTCPAPTREPGLHGGLGGFAPRRLRCAQRRAGRAPASALLARQTLILGPNKGAPEDCSAAFPCQRTPGSTGTRGSSSVRDAWSVIATGALHRAVRPFSLAYLPWRRERQ